MVFVFWYVTRIPKTLSDAIFKEQAHSPTKYGIWHMPKEISKGAGCLLHQPKGAKANSGVW